MGKSSTIENVEKFCSEQNIKLTTKRKEILMSLLNSEKALSAYELVKILKDKGGAATAAMSVYRILDFLENNSLVHKLKLTNKYVACSQISCDHKQGSSQFLICNDCDSVKEITVDQKTMTALKSRVKSAGFSLRSLQLEMDCVCSKCDQIMKPDTMQKEL